MISKEMPTIDAQENNRPAQSLEAQGADSMDNVQEGNITEKSIELIKKIVFEKLERRFRESGDFEVYDLPRKFVDEMEVKYGRVELERCKLFHAITGSSTPEEKHVPNIDLPEGEIEKFIMSL